jgi:hypothetical protein
MSMERASAPETARDQATADMRRALGMRIKLAPTREERAAAGRALITFRKRMVVTCALCGAAFERYANGPRSVRQFCSQAHRSKVYRLEHGERLREQCFMSLRGTTRDENVWAAPLR